MWKGAAQMVKIMVVDDDPFIVDVLRRFFTRRGYDIVSADNGEACLEKIGNEKPDVVILDINMPDVSGWEVCRRIKEDPSTRYVKITMLSSHSTWEDIRKSYDAGADIHLTKPFKLYDILKTIESLIGSKDQLPARMSRLNIETHSLY